MPKPVESNPSLCDNDQLRLPVELIFRIAEVSVHSSRESTSSLLRVSRWLRTFVLPLVYSSLVIEGTASGTSGIGWVGRLKSCPQDFSTRIPVAADVEVAGSSMPDGLSSCPSRHKGPSAQGVWATTWGDHEPRVPHDAHTLVHSVYFLPPLFKHKLSSGDLPSAIFQLNDIRRLSIHTEVFHALLRDYRGKTRSHDAGRGLSLFTTLRELHLDDRITDAETTLSLVRSYGAVLNCLTHLRLSGAIVEEIIPDLRRITASQLPALTHIAWDYIVSGASKTIDHAVKDFLQGAPTRLQYLLLVVHSSQTVTVSEAERTMDVVLHGAQDERLLSVSIGSGKDDNWIIWERLAREDQNIWDEALARRARNLV